MMELACLPAFHGSLEPWLSSDLTNQGRQIMRSGVREGPCSTVLSKKRQGLRTKTNKWQRNSDTYVHTNYWVPHISNTPTTQHYSV